MTTRRNFIAAAASLAAAPLAGMAPAQAQMRRIAIGTNPAGTDYYQIGGGLAKLFSEKLGAQAIVQPYAGSSVYLPLIEAGEVTMGLSSTLDSGGAFRGEQGRPPMKKLRSLARMWPLAYAMVVRKDSPIRGVADLKGKRVVISFKANVALEPIHHAVLATAGLSAADVVPVSVGGIPQGMRGVVEGNIDATWAAVGIPAVREAHASVGVRYVDFAGPRFNDEFLGERVAGLFAQPLKPAPHLSEVTEPVQITGFDVFLIGSSELAEADAGRILDALHDNFEGLQKDYATLRRGARDLMARATNTVPYHPGATAFYRARGLWSAANDKQDARLLKS